MMNERILPILCDPETHENLEIAAGCLVNPRSGRRFAVRDGIPIFLDAEISGLNRKYQRMYDRLAPGYDFAEQAYRWFTRTTRDAARRGYLDEIEIQPGFRVLEVSVGTGANIALLPPVEFFGLDISWGMLQRCRKNLARWGLSAELFLGEGEKLPFQDGSFDAVFHFGGINFFNDRARAIAEMIRVAKPGTKIVISDETEEHVKAVYERTPFVGRHFRGRTEAVASPKDFVPPGMLEMRNKLYRDGRLYCLSFRKPA